MKVMITEFAPEVIQQQVCPKRTLKLWGFANPWKSLSIFCYFLGKWIMQITLTLLPVQLQNCHIFWPESDSPVFQKLWTGDSGQLTQTPTEKRIKKSYLRAQEWEGRSLNDPWVHSASMSPEEGNHIWLTTGIFTQTQQHSPNLCCFYWLLATHTPPFPYRIFTKQVRRNQLPERQTSTALPYTVTAFLDNVRLYLPFLPIFQVLPQIFLCCKKYCVSHIRGMGDLESNQLKFNTHGL